MNYSKRHKDHDVIKRLKKGDETTFDLLFQNYSQKIYHFSPKYLKPEKDAEHVLQVIFLKTTESQELSNSEFKHIFRKLLNDIYLQQLTDKYKRKKKTAGQTGS